MKKKCIIYIILFLTYSIVRVSAQDCLVDDTAQLSCGTSGFVTVRPVGTSQFCENQTVEFENLSDPADNWDYFEIDFGDGTPIVTVNSYDNVSHTFNFSSLDKCEEGPIFQNTYCFRGVRECTEGLTTNWSSGTYLVLLEPVALIDSDIIVCINEPVDIFNNSCNEDTYLWEFGNGMSSTDENPTLSYGLPGTYNVTLTVNNTCGTDQTVESITVVDFPIATINTESNGGEGCNPSRQIVSIDANEWVLTQPSGYFEWSVSGNNGDWCFTNDAQQSNPCPQDPAVNFCPCIPDSLLSPQIIDSLLQLPTLDIWFLEVGDYTVELSYGNECGDLVIEEIITIYEPPSIEDFNNLNACDELVICYDDLPINFNGDITSYNWIFTGGSIQNFNDSDPDYGCVTFTGMGSISVTIEAFDPCDDVTETIEVNIIETGVVTVEDPVPNLICQNDSAIFLNPIPAGGSYFINGIEVDFISGDTLYPSLVEGGNYTVDYILNTDCDAQDEFNFIILESPMVTLGDNSAECESILNYNPNIEMISGDIDNYFWSLCNSMGIAILTSTDADPSFNYNIPGEYIIKLELSSIECGSVFDSSTVVIQANDPATIDPFDNPYCPGVDPIALTASPAGGTWSGLGIIDVNSGVFDPSLLTTSSATITYSIEADACSSTDMQVIEVVLNDIALPTPDSVCFYAGLYTLGIASPIAGTWSGNNLVDSINGIIDLTGLTIDSLYTYTYCVESTQIDCESCKSTTLYIKPNPESGFSLNGSPCSGNNFMLINESIGATNYMWDFGDGNTSTSVNPIHMYSSQGDYDLLLIAMSEDGCADTISQLIHVTAPPTVDVMVLTEEGCAPLLVDYINSSFGEDITQFWIIGGQDTLFGAEPNIVLDGVSSDSIMTVELIVQNDCETVRSLATVLVHPTPIAYFGIRDDEGCSPDTVIFVNDTSGLPDTFCWDFGNGQSSKEFGPDTIVYTSPEDSVSMYTITLIAENMCGIDTFSKDIVVYPNNIDAFFEIDTLSGCPPLAVNITSFATPGAVVTYDFGDGGTGDIADTTYIFTEPGEYIITQYAAQCGIDSIKSDTITIFPLADVNFDMPTFSCIGDTVIFNNESIGGTVTLWDFGDGNSSMDFNTTHIYNQSGNFDVTLIVYSDFYNCPDTLIKSIIIPTLPNAQFNTEPLESCPGDIVTFTSTGSGDLDYEWDFGDGAGANQAIVTHMYSESGVYEVKLTVFDQFGCSSDSTFINMIVHPDPIADISLSAIEICQFYDTIQVQDLSTGSIANQWYVDDNIYAAATPSIDIFAYASGESTIKLVVANAFGCTDSISNTFNVLESPIAIISMIDTMGCQPFNISIEDLSENSNLTTWLFDGSNTSSNILANHIYLDDGIYSNVLIAGNTNGCPNDSTFFDIEVFPKSKAAFDIVAFDSCGIPATIVTENLSTFSTTYNWDFGEGSTSSLFEPTKEYNIADDYIITLYTSNEFGCLDTVSHDIHLYPQPLADFSLSDSNFCEGDTIVFNNLSTNSTHFTYLINGEDTTYDFPISLVEVGEYDLTIIANFEEVCTDTFPFIQTISIHDSPIAGFTFVADADMEIKSGVDFFLMSINYNDWIWDFGDGNTSTEENPFYEYDGDGPQTVCLTAYNYNDGEKTCEDKIQEEIKYKDSRSFFVPNAMSPDQDFGVQEVGVFKPKGVGIDRYELKIYSPWGDLITTLNQLSEGEPLDYWDGTYNGSPVPMGAYVWEAIVWFSETDKVPYRGTVTVIR